MKQLTDYIEEKLLINKDYSYDKITPKSFRELRDIITKRSKENPKSIDLSDIDVSQVDAFVDLSGFGIFGGCSARVLEYIDVTGWDVSHIDNFFELFAWLSHLKEIKGIEDWKISPKATTTKMFVDVPKEAWPSWYE